MRISGLDQPTFESLTTRQVAWLRARLPASGRSESLGPVVFFNRPPENGERSRMLFSSARASPSLDSVTDAARIRKHVDGFLQMVEDFRRDPTLKPD
jgi:hypothetical protein